MVMERSGATGRGPLGCMRDGPLMALVAPGCRAPSHDAKERGSEHSDENRQAHLPSRRWWLSARLAVPTPRPAFQAHQGSFQKLCPITRSYRTSRTPDTRGVLMFFPGGKAPLLAPKPT